MISLKLLVFLVIFCSIFVHGKDTHTGNINADKWVSSVLNYLNSNSNGVYVYEKGYLIYAQNKVDITEVTVEVDAVCLENYPEIPCANRVLVCNAFVGPAENDLNSYRVLSDVKCSPKIDIVIHSTDDDRNIPSVMAAEKTTEDSKKFDLSSEAISPSQGNADFFAIRKDYIPCLGCPYDLNTNAEGVEELTIAALRHIESEKSRKYTITNVRRLQQQVVAGMKYILLVDVAQTTCSKDDVLSTSCLLDTSVEPLICEIIFIERPWISTSKGIIKNNCTVSQEFEPVGGISKRDRNDMDNEISINDDNLNFSLTNNDVQQPEKMEEEMDASRLADLESQIILGQLFDAPKTSKVEDPEKLKQSSHVQPEYIIGQEENLEISTETDGVQIEPMKFDDVNENKSPFFISVPIIDESDPVVTSYNSQKDESVKTSEENLTKRKIIFKNHSPMQHELDQKFDGSSESYSDSSSNYDNSYSKEIKKSKVNEVPVRIHKKSSSESSSESEDSSKTEETSESDSHQNENTGDSSEDVSDTRETCENDFNLRSKREHKDKSDSDSSNSESDEDNNKDSEDDSSKSSSSLDSRSKIESKEKHDSKSSDSSDDSDNENNHKNSEDHSSKSSKSMNSRSKRESKKRHYSDSDSSSDDDSDNDDRKEKMTDSRGSRNKNNHESDDQSSSSSISSKSDDDDKSERRHRRSIGQMEKISMEEKVIVRDLADFAALTLDNIDDDHYKRVILQILGAKKLKLDGIYYQIILRLGISHCHENEHNENCREKLLTNLTKICKVQVHVEDDYSNPKVVKSQCQNIKKDENDRNKTNYSRFRRSVLLGGPIPMTADDPRLNKIINSTLEHLDSASDHPNRHKAVEIVSATSQVVAGVRYIVTARIGLTDCKKSDTDLLETCNILDDYEPETCTIDVWDRPWLNKTLYKIKCNDLVYKFGGDAENNREKRSFSTSGDSTIDEYKATRIINEALKYFSSKSASGDFKLKNIKNILVSEGKSLWNIEANVVHCEVNNYSLCSLQSKPISCKFTLHTDVSFMERHKIEMLCDTDEHTYVYEPIEEFKATGYSITLTEAFNHFIRKYNKSYAEYEYKYRLKVFKDNINKIRLLNEYEKGTARYGITQFTDITEKEFSQSHGYRSDLKLGNEIPFMQAKIPDIGMPIEFDWRTHGAVTEIKNQGLCGSCWAFSVTGNVEGQYAIHHGKLLEFSEQELVDCDKLDDGCNGGLMDNAYRAIERLGGLETESDYPYEGDDEKCSFKLGKVKVELTGALNISHNETDMAKWLVQNGPISIAINANAMQFYLGGVSHPWKALCNPKSLDHGVLIVGYGIHKYTLFNKTLPYWIVKNSWGTSWGEQGYYRVYRGDGTCGLNQTPSSAIIS